MMNFAPTTPEEQIAALDVLIRAVHTRDADHPLSPGLFQVICNMPNEDKERLGSLLIALLRMTFTGDDKQWAAFLKELSETENFSDDHDAAHAAPAESGSRRGRTR
jgi:hypothetical protein